MTNRNIQQQHLDLKGNYFIHQSLFRCWECDCMCKISCIKPFLAPDGAVRNLELFKVLSLSYSVGGSEDYKFRYAYAALTSYGLDGRNED